VSDDLFTVAGDDVARSRAPLAARMRPRSVGELIGQEHLLAAGSPVRRLIDDPKASLSVILHGPPGSGKTTVAMLIADTADRHFVELSAVNSGVAQVRAAIDGARRQLGSDGRGTVLFIDEVHRFSRTQQDALLPAVENGWVTLVAATTENPHMSVIGPLQSRSILVPLEPLTAEQISEVLVRALSSDRGFGGEISVADDVLAAISRAATGDARWALTALDAAAQAAVSDGRSTVGSEDVATAVQRAQVRHDRAGDAHYDVVSALIKSIRGSDADAALHYLARMIDAGEDPRFIARRLVILASEDVGLADPTALLVAVAAAEAAAMVGLPEARIPLAQAVLHLALAPKSNSAYRAVDAALSDVRAGRTGPVPLHLRGSVSAWSADSGSPDYRYPHDAAAGVVAQQYAPDELVGVRYYEPGRRGAEAELGERWQRLRSLLRPDSDE